MSPTRLLAPAAVVMLLVGIAVVDRGVTAADDAPSTSVAVPATGSPSTSAPDVDAPTPAPASPAASPAAASPSDGPTAAGPADDTTDASSSDEPDETAGASPTPYAGIEVIPEEPGSTPTGLPVTTTAETGPLVTLPLPAASSARGGLTGGYPTRVLPPVPGSTLVSSSVSPSGDRLQVALTGSDTRPGTNLLRFYRKRLARWDFREVPTRAVGGSTAAAFQRGASTVVVTVGSASGATTYDVFAVLRAGGA